MTDWISVEDRLPDVGAACVVSRKLPETEQEYWFGCCIYREFGFPYTSFDDPFPITHWMPLPDPPEDNP